MSLGIHMTAENELQFVAKPNMPSAAGIIPYLEQIDETAIYSNMGPLSREFESRIAQIIGVDPANVATCSNATMAITGALCTAFDPGKVIKVPSWTFAASPLAIHAAGMIPQFVDVMFENWESSIPQCDTPGVHVLAFGSRGLNLNDEVANGIQTPLVIDAAASFASLQDIELPDDRDWALIISTHATKTLGSGEGGLFISNNSEWATGFRRWSNFGFWGTRESKVLGSNAKMSEYHAAVGLASLDAWEKTKADLQKLQTYCLEASNSMGFLTQPSMLQKDLSTYWIAQFKDPEHKQRVSELFVAKNIGHRDWWGQGAHEMEAFKEFPRDSSLSSTERLANSTLGLPFHLGLAHKHVDLVSNLISSCL